MSSISAVSGSSSTAYQNRFDPAKMRDKLFAKVDTNGTGSIDKTELQGLADKVASVTGNASTNTDDIFAKADSDGDGKLSKDEFTTALQSIMPQPSSSTVDFAQAHGGAGGTPPDGPPPDGPPPGGASDSTTTSSASSTSGTSGTSSSSSSGSASTTYDPLDTNQDGVVSTAERLAGALKAEKAQALLTSMDTDGDGKVSSSEASAFAQSLTNQVQANASASQSASTPSSDASSSGGQAQKQHQMGFSRIAELVLQQYDQVANNLSSQSSGSTVSALA